MSILNLHTASLDQIVFEGRNKAYGAFVLRQVYNRHLARALAITVALCLVLVSIPLVVQRLWPAAVPLAKDPLKDMIQLTDVVMTQPKPALPATPAARAQPMAVVTPQPATTLQKVVPDDALLKPQPTTDAVITNDNILADIAPSGATTAGTGVGTPGAAGTDSGAATVAPPAKPFVYVEVMPEFAGGISALRQYMQRNLHFPRQALAAAISGKVFVSFTVQADGSISDVQVLKGLGYGTDEEAARVVSNMPSWTPGRQNSRPVAVRYTLPITFQYE
ncbi:energy transducer TonB [Hymenobacter elongatus]|uniref:Energy transducer TonB n=1 Tax=Hymenobacter elongatus TaxID=877208 RepID=A0A4Z0PLU4_9BACT|nr:energy transducer TonB [Hymenobacter elongatus]TGE17153.1 energy transducer TonB [Hymenobacter elongatus]